MNNKIEILDIEEEKNVYVVGDIHGCYDTLIQSLKERNFNFEKDLLLSVGDLVDRGPQNEKCITLIDEPWFKTVRGNHEDYCLMGCANLKIEEQHKTVNNGGAWLYKHSTEERNSLIEPFKTLPYMIEVNYMNKKIGIVHADLPIQDWNVLKLMLENDGVWMGRKIKDHLTWGRDLVYKDYADIANVDYVFLGHTVLNTPKAVGNAIFIDTGVVFGYGRKLTIVNLKEFIEHNEN